MEPHVLESDATAKGAQTLTNHLTAVLEAGKVMIQGSKARVKLPRGSGAHVFKFQLTDRTGLHVRFSEFGAELGETCPSAPGGNGGGQITSVVISDSKAEFTDENTEAYTFGYAWFFACDDENQRPTFDPIIDNGGR